MIFDNIKLFSQEGTNEILIKYICSDCKKLMCDPPYYYHDFNPETDEHIFLCENCYKEIKKSSIKEIILYELGS